MCFGIGREEEGVEFRRKEDWPIRCPFPCFGGVVLPPRDSGILRALFDDHSHDRYEEWELGEVELENGCRVALPAQAATPGLGLYCCFLPARLYGGIHFI